MNPLEESPGQAPVPGAALVVARWNSWVRLYWPDTGRIEWVDLREAGYENLSTRTTTAP